MKPNTAAKQFIKQTMRQLTCSLSMKRQKKTELEQLLRSFLEDYPDALFEDITEAFGTPTHMAEELLCDISESEQHKWLRHKTQLRIIRVAAIFAVVVLTCAAAGFFYWERENNPHEIRVIAYQNEMEIPARTQNGLRYQLSYQLDEQGNILAAFDTEGNAVAVDEKGVPLAEDDMP